MGISAKEYAALLLAMVVLSGLSCGMAEAGEELYCGRPGTEYLAADCSGSTDERDCYVNDFDFASIAAWWLAECPADTRCNGADINLSGRIDLGDIVLLAIQWLWCTDPANADCSDGDIEFDPYLRSASGYRGAVSAGRASTVDAGMQMLVNGGNAFEAAAAALLAVGAGEQYFGLEVPIIFYHGRQDTVKVLSGQGPAPALATWQFFYDNYANHKIPLSGRSIHNAAAPGLLLACLTMLKDYGTMSFQEVAQPMLGLLGGSSDLADTMNRLVAAEQNAISGGGDRIDGLTAVRDYFYDGPVADEIEAWMVSHGGLIRKSDMAAYAANWTPLEDPVSVDYKGYTVYKCGTWTQGPYMLETLNILEGFDLPAMGHNSADYIHTVVEAMKLGLGDRDHYFGDPDFVYVPLEPMLSKEYAALRRGLINPGQALLQERLPGDPDNMIALIDVSKSASTEQLPNNDTTTCITADRWGNVVVATPSGWGGAGAIGDTGVKLGSRLISFKSGPDYRDHPNVVASGKRPSITLTPTMVFANNRPIIGISVAGGDKQDQTALNVLLNLVEFGMTPADAVSSKRVGTYHHNNLFTQADPVIGSLVAPGSVGSGVISELESRGHNVTTTSRWGSPSVLVIDPQTRLLQVAGDPAAGRHAAAY